MESVYEQVILTCTIINVMIFAATTISFIIDKVSEHRRKKREEQRLTKSNEAQQ
ncbi:MAG: hypothetical protein LKF15_10685 [Lachnospiraceae bacterium]|jgi:hypothetical protein|nr:hypothetical protein [Lachnospiraceae bacterium]MCH4067253.1 hypothetical protein [Lachnospiraceae bacterium]MCH4113278.1 hypothetical protein [Lachnospiraceae bacterium]